MLRRVSLAMSQEVRGRARHDGKTYKNVGPERQVDSGIDWPVRPQMQLVAPISIAEVTVLCRFLRAEAKLSPSCVGRVQEVDEGVCLLHPHALLKWKVRHAPCCATNRLIDRLRH